MEIEENEELRLNEGGEEGCKNSELRRNLVEGTWRDLGTGRGCSGFWLGSGCAHL
jgi:hypothetical protein